MNYLVTGGTGFLGSYICKQLIARGDTAIAFSRTSPDANCMSEILSPEEIAQVVYVQGDITDLVKLVLACKEHRVDMIISTASLLLDACNRNPRKAVETNILGTMNCFDAARICGMKRVVWASSNSAIGGCSGHEEEFLPNDTWHRPTSIYGATKTFLEFMGDYYHEAYGLEVIGLRYVVIYGKGRRRGGANYIKNMLNDPALGTPSVVTCADDTPNFVYVEDAARAALLAAESPYKRGAYNITGEWISMRDLREYVLTLLPDAKIDTEPGALDIAWKFDTSVEEQELGYVPEYGIKRGALITINDVRENAGLPMIEPPA